MPRKVRRFEELARREGGELSARLADELKQNRPSGQPTIYEEEFPTGKTRVLVIWDDFDRLSMEERTAIILRAYRDGLGQQERDRIALASGLTVPEASAAGMLPFQLIPAIRKGDSVTAEECRKAMIDDGASVLLGEDRPMLRFSTADEAEAAKQRLSEQLPRSEQVWVVTQDVGRVEQWIDN
jgi:hypothetical protein